MTRMSAVGGPGVVPRVWLLALLLLVCAPSVMAAPFRPPLQELRHPHYTLLAATVDAVDAGQGSVVLRDIEVLRKGMASAPGESMSLHLSAADVGLAQRGQRVLLVYTDVRRDASQPRNFVRTGRNILVSTDGAEPALFPDTARWRSLLGEAHRTVEQQDDYRSMILAGLASADPREVDLWTAELVHRPATFPVLDEGEIGRLAEIVADRRQPPSARARLLLVALEKEPAWGSAWLPAAALSVLGQYQPATLQAEPRADQAVHAALIVLGRHGQPQHRDTLARWLRAREAIAELAADALARLGAPTLRAAFEEALADDSLPDSTRRMIERRLARVAQR